MLKYVVAAVVVLCGLFVVQRFFMTPDNPIQIPQTATSVGFTVEEFARGLEVPWSLVWTSPNRLLVSERPGRIRVIENGQLITDALYTFPDVVSSSEEGLMSLAVHPKYAENKLLYAVYAYETEDGIADRVVRFKDNGNRISDIEVILENIPAARYHAGSRLAFGPDGMLYITTGDATDGELAQDKQSLAGKILRVRDDGTIPNDNPFPNSPVWSYGHRNSQGIAWMQDGTLLSTEHGPSGFDGPGGGDEVNVIVRGSNYGWPIVSHGEHKDGMIDPIALYTPAEAPASALVYSGTLLPQFAQNLFFGALRGEGVWRLTIEGGKAVGQEKMFTEYGRIRDVAEGPDGAIYFSTSNRDGRGSPQENDDRIFRVVPSEAY